MPWWGSLIIILAIVAAGIIVIYLLGKRNQKKMDEQQVQIDASKQSVTMLVIDKKKLKIKQAGMPQMVVDQVPWYLRWRRFPVVKAKVGPRVMTFIADNSVYDQIPLKTEIKASVSGLYIVEVKSIRTPLTSKKKEKEKTKGKTGKAIDTLLKKGRGEI